VDEDVEAPLPGRTGALAATVRLKPRWAEVPDEELLALLDIHPDAPPLFELARLPPEELEERLGRRAAGIVLAAIELGRRSLRATETRPRLQNPQQVYEYLEPALAGLGRERFHVLCFNTRNILIADVLLGEGTQDRCPVEPRDVYIAALRAGAQRIVLAHNHPSGDAEPSSNDLDLTRQLVEGSHLLRITVLDHLVVGAGCYVSMAERGMGGLGRGSTSITAER
jgi:DNA repair protein RadC